MSKLQWWIRNFMNSDSASYSLWLDSVLHHRSVNPEEGRSSLWSSSLSSLSRLVTALALYLLIHFFDSLSRDVLRWYYITVRTTFLLFLIRVRQWDYYLYIDHVSSLCVSGFAWSPGFRALLLSPMHICVFYSGALAGKKGPSALSRFFRVIPSADYRLFALSSLASKISRSLSISAAEISRSS